MVHTAKLVPWNTLSSTYSFLRTIKSPLILGISASFSDVSFSVSSRRFSTFAAVLRSREAPWGASWKATVDSSPRKTVGTRQYPSSLHSKIPSPSLWMANAWFFIVTVDFLHANVCVSFPWGFGGFALFKYSFRYQGIMDREHAPLYGRLESNSRSSKISLLPVARMTGDSMVPHNRKSLDWGVLKSDSLTGINYLVLVHKFFNMGPYTTQNLDFIVTIGPSDTWSSSWCFKNPGNKSSTKRVFLPPWDDLELTKSCSICWTNSGWIITVRLLLDIFHHIEDSPIHTMMHPTKDEASKVGISLIQSLS